MQTVFNRSFFAVLLALVLGVCTLKASRIKDITEIEGLRENQLVGYGLVVGLAGTGDSSFTPTSNAIKSMLKRFGMNPGTAALNPSNVAAVMLTADVGPYTKPGARIDITVSSLGSATTLQGGVLLQSPLLGADGTVYAVAQGGIAVGGFLGGGGGDGGATVQQNHPTVGQIAGGAIIEREIPTEVLQSGALNLLLTNPDYASAVRIADIINGLYPGSSQAMSSGTVNVKIPPQFVGQEPNFIAAIGSLEIMPDVAARVVINERTGTIVATSNVRISTVAVSHGSLTISISNTQQVSQPGALAQVGSTEKFNNSQTDVNEVAGGFEMIEDFPTLERLTSALNALGVSTREMMSILQAIKSAGALHAELILN